jgi:UDP-N-acetylmuramoylalanine--D-glutamate ligase
MPRYWTEGEGRRVGVAGLGKSGRAAARLLAGKGFTVIGYDDNPAVEPCECCSENYIGGGGFEALPTLEGIVLSPGIGPSAPIPAAAAAAGLPVIGEIELAFRNTQVPILAVTGSNGKTTTAEWTGFILRKAGLRAVVAGNVGYPFTAAVLDHPSLDWFVLEVSSYQLETIDKFRPAGAAVLNLTPDHLQRHGNMEGYRNAKARIFMNQHSEDLAILNADDPESAPLLGLARGIEGLFSLSRSVETGAFLEDGQIIQAWGGERTALLPASGISIPGLHNVANALASICLAARTGIPGSAMLEGLKTFPGVAHRIERIRSLGGVEWVNDSKSTNQDSLRVALESFGARVILIAGGLSKGTDYGSLRALVAEKVRHLVLIGSAAEELAEAWEGAAPVTRAGDLARAVGVCRELAGPGDTVLLSPACASFDQYRNFEERGDHFRRLVEELS